MLWEMARVLILFSLEVSWEQNDCTKTQKTIEKVPKGYFSYNHL